jgi:hypothetical protein
MRRLVWLTLLGGCVIGDDGEGSTVRFEAGAPAAVDFVPGRVVHEVCIAVDVEEGFVRPVALVDDGAIGPGDGAAIQPDPLDGVECPTGDEWTGFARIEWRTHTGRAVVTFERSAASGPATSGDVPGLSASDSTPGATSGDLVLRGERFPGYDVVVEEVTTTGPAVTVPFVVGYRAAGVLEARPAESVPLRLSIVPDATPDAPSEVIGSSTGDGTITTDPDGRVYVFLDPAAFSCDLAAEYALFVTPEGGGTVLAATLPCL